MLPDKLEVGRCYRAPGALKVCDISQIWLILQHSRLYHTTPRPMKENCKHIIEQVKYTLVLTLFEYLHV